MLQPQWVMGETIHTPGSTPILSGAVMDSYVAYVPLFKSRPKNIHLGVVHYTLVQYKLVYPNPVYPEIRIIRPSTLAPQKTRAINSRFADSLDNAVAHCNRKNNSRRARRRVFVQSTGEA